MMTGICTSTKYLQQQNSAHVFGKGSTHIAIYLRYARQLLTEGTKYRILNRCKIVMKLRHYLASGQVQQNSWKLDC